MDNLFQTSLFAGVTVSLVAYLLGMLLKKKFKLAILNPLLISIVLTIIVLVVAMWIMTHTIRGHRTLAGF